jgi:hypothetical protein
MVKSSMPRYATAPLAAVTALSGPSFNFCRVCGNLVCWRGLKPAEDGRTRIAVNLRLAEPGDVANVPLQRFEGLRSFEDLPRDGRHVADVWF